MAHGINGNASKLLFSIRKGVSSNDEYFKVLNLSQINVEFIGMTLVSLGNFP